MATFSRDEIFALIASVLTTKLETEPGPSPASSFYLLLNMDADRYETFRTLMVQAELITTTESQWKLTAKGRQLAKDCAAAVPVH